MSKLTPKAENLATFEEYEDLRSHFVADSEVVGTLRSQFVTSKGKGGRRYRPFAFTEPGIAMLSSVLRKARPKRSIVFHS